MVKIFVGNLGPSTVREDIQILFEKYGKVTECDVLKNYGFVHMASMDEAEEAIKNLDGSSVKGSRMRVEKSTGKSGGGRGGRGGGGGKMRGGRGGGRGDRYGGGGGGGGRYGDPYSRPPAPPSYGRDYDRYGGGGGGASRDRMPMRGSYDYDRRPPMDDYRDRYGYGGYDARRTEYDRYERPPARDPYYADRGAASRPPPEYYNRRPPPGPEGDRLTAFSNGHDTNYYDRFYKKTSALESAPPQKVNSQGFLQSEPLYF